MHTKMNIVKPEDARHQMLNWSKCRSEEFFQYFERFSSENNENGFNDQFERLCHIDYGEVPEEFLKFIQGMGSSDVLQLCLGLLIDVEKGSKAFNIFFETRRKDESTYWGFKDPVKACGFSLTASDSESFLPRYGISPELKNQLTVNWRACPTNLFPQLFYSQGINERRVIDIVRNNKNTISRLENLLTELVQDNNKKIDREVASILDASLLGLASNPVNRVLVRARSYPIVGYNLNALKVLLNSKSMIKVHLGMNMSDFYRNDDLFTLIIELNKTNDFMGTKSSKEEEGVSTFLDFVQACPPICCKPGEPDDPCQGNQFGIQGYI